MRRWARRLPLLSRKVMRAELDHQSHRGKKGFEKCFGSPFSNTWDGLAAEMEGVSMMTLSLLVWESNGILIH